MKKVLSVLLILAALFGFYGGAVNIKDVMAAKAYWEDKSEQTTADLNKLEDGLNQLKDNEQAYLDGLDAVKEGEKALAEGEEELAEGEATLAQGEADYAAAPGKLADARAQLNKGESDLAAGRAKLAAGEKELSDGYEAYEAAPGQIASLNSLIKGLQKARNGYLNEWRPNYVKNGTKAKEYSDGGLRFSRNLITKTLNTDENKASVKLIENLSGMSGLLDGVSSKKSYASYDKGIKKLSRAFNDAAKALTELNNMVKQYAADNDDTKKLKSGLKSDTAVPTSYDSDGNPSATKALNKMTLKETEDALAKMNKVISAGEEKAKAAKSQLDSLKSAISNMKALEEKGCKTFEQGGDNGKALAQALGADPSDEIASVKSAKQSIVDAGQQEYDAATKKLAAAKTSSGLLTELIAGRKQAQQTIAGVKKKAGDKLAMAGSLDSRLSSLGDAIEALDGDPDIPNGTYAETYEKLQEGLKTLSEVLDKKIEEIKSNKAKFDAWHKGYVAMKSGKDTMSNTSSGIPYAFSNMLSNKTVRTALNDNAKSLIPYLQAYKGNRLNNDDFPAFSSDMDTISNTIIPKALQVLYGIRKEALKSYNEAPEKLAQGEAAVAAGKKELAAGEAKLAAGYKQYRQGLADYEAAPAKLEEGRRAVEEGRQKLADGRKELAEGKEKLEEYEDGEKQVRDGLATLMASERYADLETILERRNGDDNFDDADKHLDIPDGLKAVGTGREYQADTGDVVTKELSGRVLGTGLELGAAVIALLAALLSLLKKFKGAAAAAIATAVVGVGGMLAGSNAGMEMSSIAGSTIGATPTVAAVILAIVAALFSIVHFTAKKDSDS